MSKYTYKTKDGTKTGFVPGIGAITDGSITSHVLIESPNLELVHTDEAAPAAPVVGTASPQNPNQPQTAEGPVTLGVSE